MASSMVPKERKQGPLPVVAGLEEEMERLVLTQLLAEEGAAL